MTISLVSQSVAVKKLPQIQFRNQDGLLHINAIFGYSTTICLAKLERKVDLAKIKIANRNRADNHLGIQCLLPELSDEDYSLYIGVDTLPCANIRLCQLGEIKGLYLNGTWNLNSEIIIQKNLFRKIFFWIKNIFIKPGSV